MYKVYKTKAVMIAHTLGNPFDLSAVKAFCDKHNLWLVEDNCDALGGTYTIDGEEKLIGTIGDIMPLIDENRTMIKYGLKVINRGERVGLVHF